MQSPLLVSVDLMSAGPPNDASSTKTGPDGVFAAHLAAASQEQTTPPPQAKLLDPNKQKSHTSSSEPVPNADSSTIASQSEIAEVQENIPSADNTDKEDVLDNLLSGAMLNVFAGAAGIGIPSAPWTGGTNEPAQGQNIAGPATSESAVYQLLNAITSATDGTMAVLQTNSPTTQAKAVTTDSATTAAVAQPFTSEVEQPQPSTNLTTAPLDTNGTSIVPDVGSSAINRMTQNADTVLQPEATVSFLADTAPTAEAVSMTEQPATTAPSVAGQPQPSTPRADTQQEPTHQGADQIVQNKFGQIITIYQTNISGETAAGSKPPVSSANSQNLDGVNNFTQPHLPNAAPKTIEEDGGNPQQENAQDNQQKAANFAKTITNVQVQADQFMAQAPSVSVGAENQSLIFPHQQTSVPPATYALAPEATALQLPSGLSVPGETVIDQMIAHFSINKRLESGIVNLKLHPQELGELRMEIKVTQDTIKAHIIAQNPQAQEMIHLHLPRLREALEQQGLHLQQVDVTVAANDNAGREQFQGNTGQHQLNQSMLNRGSQPIFTLDRGKEIEEAAPAVNMLSVLA